MESNRVVINIVNGIKLYVSPEDIDKLRTVSINYNSRYNRVTVYDKATKQSFQLGRFLLEVTNPEMVVDHIDGNALNNCRENLRICRQLDNIKNQRLHVTKKSGLPKGVSLDRRRDKYLAQIRHEGRQIFLGYFTCIAAAERAYKEAAEKYFGQFASHLSRPQ